MNNDDKTTKQNDIDIEIDGQELTDEQLAEIQGGLGSNVDIVQLSMAYGEPRAAV